MKAIPLKQIIEATGKSRQLLMFHLKSLQKANPSIKIYFKEGRNNYITEEGIKLLEEKFSCKIQQKEKKKKKEEKNQKVKGKEKESFSNLEKLINQILDQQNQLNQILKEIKEENKKKDEQIESLYRLLENQQQLTQNQQKLTLMEKTQKTELVAPSQSEQKSENSIKTTDKFLIYIKAIRDIIFRREK